MKKTATILTALALSTAASFAGPPPPMAPPPGPPPPISSDRCAGGISYNNVELLYANTDADTIGSSGDADGVRLNFEYSPASNFYIRLTTGYDEADYWDLWHITAAVGGYIALSDNIHVAADGGIIWAEFEEDYFDDTAWLSFSDDDTGWFVRPHLRAKWGCLEVHAGVQYTDIWDEEDWAFFASAYYQIWGNWDIKVGYNEGDMDTDAEVWTVGARYRF